MFDCKELNELFKDTSLFPQSIIKNENQELEIQTALQKWNHIPDTTWEEHQQYCERLMQLRPIFYDIAIQGNAHAQYLLYYLDVRTGNVVQGLIHLKQSASLGYVLALKDLSQEYKTGYYLQRNLSLSKLLCCEAMKRGNKEAEFLWNVARFTESYFGEPRNFRLGLENAVKLKHSNEHPAQFLSSYITSSREALDSDDERQDSDYVDLRETIGWVDENSDSDSL
jgi:hypothetical protein